MCLSVGYACLGKMPYKNEEEQKKYLQEWKKKNKEYLRKYSRELYKKNIELNRKRNYLNKYPDGNWEYYEAVTHCEICGVLLKKGKTRDGKCQDHCHTTKQVRKVVCQRCNHLIGCLEDKSLPPITFQMIREFMS